MGSGQKRDRRLQKLAMDVLGALTERDATIWATEERIAAALYVVVAGDGLTISVELTDHGWRTGPVVRLRDRS